MANWASKGVQPEQFACTRCGCNVRRDTAVALVIEVLEGGRVVERRAIFNVHPSCAAIAEKRLITHTARRYQARKEIEIRHSQLPLDAGRPWIPA